MSAGSAGKLYTPAMLSLATELADFPFASDLPHIASARSRTCGSTAVLGLALAVDGTVDRVGLKISACAIGQASAALLARSIKGRSAQDVRTVRTEIDNWLGGEGELPAWPDLRSGGDPKFPKAKAKACRSHYLTGIVQDVSRDIGWLFLPLAVCHLFNPSHRK